MRLGIPIHHAFRRVGGFAPASGRSRFAAAFGLLLSLFLAGCSTTEVMEPVPTLASPKYAAIVVDGDSGRVLYESQSEAPRFPASLTKMMTLYLLFEAIDAGRVDKSTAIPVSRNAAAQPPSKLGLKSGGAIDVDTAIRALATKSANDVAVAVAEFIAGSEAAFASRMTAQARALGLNRTVFRNASGLPDSGQVSTARDMAVLGIALKRRFPHHYHYFAAREFAYAGRAVRGHNKLLGNVRGVDGIKTGYTRASGFNIVTSVRRDGKHLIIVVLGGETGDSRNAQVQRLMDRYL